MDWRRYTPSPRAVDWGLFAAVATVLATGVATIYTGTRATAWVVDLHAVAGVVLVCLLPIKLWRVRHRVTPERLTATRALSVLLALDAAGALATGVWWVFGGSLDLGPWGLFHLHTALGLLVAPLLVAHLCSRVHSPGTAVRHGRRDAVRYAGLVATGALVWRLQGPVNDALDTAGSDRRFTGSREEGSGDGNRFPVTSWVADDPDPVDADEWSLRVGGRVATERAYALSELPAGASEQALLDCTSGWYSDHEWQGVRVGDLLDAADPDDAAAWVQFRSVTGYRWSLPIEAARDALLATRVDGEVLAHGHGFPLRLVAPGRRGFQWVKWVEELRVTGRREVGEWVAIFVSGV
ncbi:molybdopterin-dependent oxidoreductase [Haloarcula sp. S1CR25-12]|uniref:Molybdopterin-dependent oxidoreductase n=1 Tax=Haloarcula saliterrae TaxID=2950534 RepID=A0ABU2FCA0_9EURY|nr:molybdopterin-dependent oxidoreductase [Haloarcula sp. S1CR25-12]MDS0259869.1 molybdopterin-dependent oxidoreductase [Haloarcula sp. S1CR25-12]